MEYFLINEFFSYWYATIIMTLLTCLSIFGICGAVFFVTIVYDITRQVIDKYKRSEK